MLPKEVGNLFAAVKNSTSTTLDAERLGVELAGLATLHQTLLDQGVLTAQQIAVFQKLRFGTRHDLGLTAPPQGPPEIHLKITAPVGGIPPVKIAGDGSVNCPHCGKSFTVKP